MTVPTELAQVYTLIDGAKGAATLAVALIALVGAIAGTITSYIVAGRTVYINSITAERSKWIEKLRVNIATYSGELAATMFRIQTMDIEEEGNAAQSIASFREAVESLNRSASTIQLQLNPWGEIDKNILFIMESVVLRLTTDVELVDRADKLLIAHARWLLKAEWEKVKFEARSPLYRFMHACSANVRLGNYRAWVAGPGSIDQLMSDFAAEKAKPVGG